MQLTGHPDSSHFNKWEIVLCALKWIRFITCIQLASYMDRVKCSLEHSAIFLYDASKVSTQLESGSEW